MMISPAIKYAIFKYAAVISTYFASLLVVYLVSGYELNPNTFILASLLLIGVALNPLMYLFSNALFRRKPQLAKGLGYFSSLVAAICIGMVACNLFSTFFYGINIYSDPAPEVDASLNPFALFGIPLLSSIIGSVISDNVISLSPEDKKKVGNHV